MNEEWTFISLIPSTLCVFGALDEFKFAVMEWEKD